MVKNQEKEPSLNDYKNYVEENEHERRSQQRDPSYYEGRKLMNLSPYDQEDVIRKKENADNQEVSSLLGMQKLYADSLGSLSNKTNQQPYPSSEYRQKEFISSFDKIGTMQKAGGKRKYTGWDSSNDERYSKEDRSIRNYVMKDLSKEKRKQANRRSSERAEKRISKLEKYKKVRYTESRKLSRDYRRRLERRSESMHSRNRDRRIPRRSESRLSKNYCRRVSRRGHGRSPIRKNGINQGIRNDENYERNLRKEEKVQHKLQNLTIPKLEPACEILQGGRNHVNDGNDFDDDNDENKNSRYISVRNIPLHCNLDQLLDLFSHHGSLIEFAFNDQNLLIAYKNVEGAKRAVQEEHGKIYLGRILNVEFCKRDSLSLLKKEKMMTLPNNSISLRKQSRSLSESTSLERKVAHRIIVKGLDRSVSVQDIKHFGQAVGPLNLVKILEDSRRELFGMIEYKLSTHVEKALDTLKYKRLNGREVSIRRYNESYEFGYREIAEMQCRDENRPNPEIYEEKYGPSKEKRNYGDKEKLTKRSYWKERNSRNEKKYGSRERMNRSRNQNSKQKIEKRENGVELIPNENFYRSVKKPNRTKRYMGEVNSEMNRRKQVRSHSLLRRERKSKGEISREFPDRESYLLQKERNCMILPKESTLHIDKRIKKWKSKRVHMHKKRKFSKEEKHVRDLERKRDLEKMTNRNKKKMCLNEDNKECIKNVETKERRNYEKPEQKKEYRYETVKQTNEKVGFTRQMEYRERASKNESLSTTDVANGMNNEDQKKTEKQMREMEEKLRFQIKHELKVENENKLRIEIEKELRVEIENKLRKEHEEILKNKLNEILKMNNEEEIQMEKYIH